MRFLLCFVILSVTAVDRNNFKKCSDSSFCERRRKFDGAENALYQITAHELINGETVLQLKLEAEGRPCLTALHSILNGGSSRMVIEECVPYKVILLISITGVLVVFCYFFNQNFYMIRLF